MTHAELIDEGYCSVSKRNSFSNKWDCMEYSNAYDLSVTGQLGDASEQYFGSIVDQALNDLELLDVQNFAASAISNEPQRTLWKPQPVVATSRPLSLTSSSASLHEQAQAQASNSFGQQPANANAWFDCNQAQAASMAATLPPLSMQQSASANASASASPSYVQDFAQPAVPQFGWPAASAGCRPSSSGLPGPSGLQFHSSPLTLEAMTVTSPSTSYNEQVQSPVSTLSGTMQQPLSPSDERRLRNNEASRRSRQNQKAKNEELQIKLYQLELENLSLKKNIDEVTKMVKYMKEKLVEYMQSKG